jgi:hypothetical protein
MPTPSPNFDLFNPLLQELRDQFERTVYPENGLESTDADVLRFYNRSFKLPYVRALIEDVLSGRWGLGNSQSDVAALLGMERSRVSDALRGGELSLDVYLRLRTYPGKPENWEPDVQRLLPEMGRSGFIGVARFYGSQVPERDGLAVDDMNELNHELLCEIVEHLGLWMTARFRKDHAIAAGIVHAVLDDQSRNIIPSWYVPRERRRSEALIRRLSSEPAWAFDHLCRLQNNWFDIMVVTWSQLTHLRWEDA